MIYISKWKIQGSEFLKTKETRSFKNFHKPTHQPQENMAAQDLALSSPKIWSRSWGEILISNEIVLMVQPFGSQSHSPKRQKNLSHITPEPRNQILNQSSARKYY